MDVIKQLEEDFNPSLQKIDDVKAKYKIELHFGRDRSISALKPSLGLITIWESGRRLHGGGDDKMYWCGYKDCGKPIRSSVMAMYHLVCPSCQRECFLDPPSKEDHIKKVRAQGGSVESFQHLPVIHGEKIFKMTPRKAAGLLAKIWYSLECNADIYVKYHRDDIRFNVTHLTNRDLDRLEGLRTRKRGRLVYPLKNILKDTSAGADLEDRFFALITA